MFLGKLRTRASSWEVQRRWSVCEVDGVCAKSIECVIHWKGAPKKRYDWFLILAREVLAERLSSLPLEGTERGGVLVVSHSFVA